MADALAVFLEPRMLLGLFTFCLFFGIILATIFRKINLPIQTVLFLSTILIFLVGFCYRLFAEGEGLVQALLLPNEMLRGVILHPITAMLAGFFLAGALNASGGFDALRVILEKLRGSPLGLAGTLVIICHLPLLVQLPCGRIIAAALLPLLFSFGSQGMGILTKAQLIVFIGAFSRSAWGTCGPSPIGGVAQMGEGFLGAHYAAASNGILRAPQSLSLILGTGLMALFLKLVTMKMYPRGTSLPDEKKEAARPAAPASAPLGGYLSLAIFVAALFFALFQPQIQFALRDHLPFPRVPVQTALVAGGLLILLVTRARLEDFMAGIILLPAASMAAGFMAAGALEATYGFQALAAVLDVVRRFPLLGVAGMLAIFVQIQAVVALACSRILYAALVPVLYYLGPGGSGLLTWDQLAVMLAAYSINAAAGCGQSPAGGCGMMSEGAVRAETGYFSAAFSITGMAVLMPLAAIVMRFQTLGYFDPALPRQPFDVVWLAGLAALVLLANWIVFRLVGDQMGKDPERNWWALFWGGTGVTVLASVVFGYCLFGGGDLGALLQAAVGGAVISVVAMVLLAPRCVEA